MINLLEKYEGLLENVLNERKEFHETIKKNLQELRIGAIYEGLSTKAELITISEVERLLKDQEQSFNKIKYLNSRIEEQLRYGKLLNELKLLSGYLYENIKDNSFKTVKPDNDGFSIILNDIEIFFSIKNNGLMIRFYTDINRYQNMLFIMLDSQNDKLCYNVGDSMKSTSLEAFKNSNSMEDVVNKVIGLMKKILYTDDDKVDEMIINMAAYSENEKDMNNNIAEALINLLE